MEEAVRAPRVARFGVFELDIGARALRKSGVAVRIQDRPLEVLAILLEQPGKVVTREELKRRLWPGTVVDFEHGLNATMKRLRDALGDDAGTPRFIETLPRRGYRFVCPVDGAPVARVDPEPSSRPRPRRTSLVVAALAVPILLLAAAALDVGGSRRLLEPPGATRSTTIAVLPLENLSGDPGQDYFADGMTEAVTAELGRIGALQVLSYESVVRYAGARKPLSELAREMGVDAFVVGEVIRAGGRVRLAASLVQATSERRLWARSYDFDLGDVLAIQRELAGEVAREIRVTVTAEEHARLATSRPVAPEAYQAYLLARAHMAKATTSASFAKAREYLEKAIENDPGYAPAYASLGELYVNVRGIARSGAEARLRAREWGERALRLDDTLSEAHMVLGRAAQQDWSWVEAEREFRRAIEVNPSNARARIWYAMFLYAMQRFEESAAQARRAQQLDPVSSDVNTWAAGAYFAGGQAEEAIASARKALELDPAYSDASLVLARTYVAQGKHGAAIETLRTALALERQPQLIGALAHAYARAGQLDEAVQLVGELEGMGDGGGGHARIALIWAFAGLGDRDRAFAALEKAYRERLGRLVWLQVDPLLEPLRSDPRFADLARRVGLPALGPPQMR